MAKYKVGVIGAISGKLGALVFNKNGTIRSNSGTTNPNTPKQATVRALLGALSNNWRTIGTPAQKAWSDASANYPQVDRLGDTFFLSGQGLYMKLNTSLLFVGETPINQPLAPAAVQSMVLASAVFDLTLVSFLIEGSVDPVPADHVWLLEASKPTGSGIQFAGRSDYRKIGVIAAAGIMPQDLQVGYDDVFGGFAYAEGDVVFIRSTMVNILTGQRSAVSTARIKMTV